MMIMQYRQGQVLALYSNNRILILCIVNTILCFVTSSDTQQVIQQQQELLLLFQHPKFITNNNNDNHFSSNEATSTGSTTGSSTNNNNYVKDSYIIKFNDTIQALMNRNIGSSTKDIVYNLMNITTTTATATATTTRNDNDKLKISVIGWIYTNAFNGFSVTNISIQRMIQILDNTIVESATRVSTVTTNTIHDTSFVQETESKNRSIVKQKNTAWNLDMLVSPYNDNEYHYKYTGAGVQAYIVDGGIDLQNNPEFKFNQVQCGWDRKYNTNCLDNDDHGTHVAGIVGSTQYGIAKHVQLISVKVLNNGGGSSDTVIAGIDWIIEQKLKSNITNNNNNTKTNTTTTKTSIPMIINLSLAGPYDKYMNAAVQRATDIGIIVVVGAGNGYGTDACTVSPASATTAITVSSIDSNYIVSKFSNSNRSCIDIMAPGQFIRSVKNCATSINGRIPKQLYRFICQLVFPYKILTGTSMSAPHITGIVALHLQKNNTYRPHDVWNAILNDARINILTDLYQYNIPNIVISTKSILS